MQDCCPQCNKTVERASSRLVQDSCGHKKCRICLLRDEEKCFLCSKEADIERNEKVIQYEDNHTAVITFKGKDCGSVNKCNETKDVKDAEVSTARGFYDASEKADANLLQINENSYVQSEKRNYHALPIPAHILCSKESPTVYTCSFCKKSFKTRSHVKYHQFCTGGVKPFRCDKCSKEFISRSHFEAHKRGHTGSKPYACEKCGKSFAQSGKLKRHSLLHSDLRPFVCQECGKSFRTKDTLRNHLVIHRKEKPFPCKLCKAKFNNSSNLRKHLAIHSKERVHMCDQCGKRFKLKSSLAIHRNTHSRLRPHNCPECSKSFGSAKDLGRHQLIHLDVKAYGCGICGTGFRRKDNLNRHMKNTHPGKKGTFTKRNVKQLLVKPVKCTTVVDNPNAINVITAPPACANAAVKDEAVKRKQSCSVPVINAPLKLAFKTSAFKNSYNIHRDYVEPSDNDVNIYEKILLPNNLTRLSEKLDDKASSDVCQKILTPLNYGTSFEHKKHAVIKNIKFKLPTKYMNLTNKEKLSDIVPLQPIKDGDFRMEEGGAQTYTELKPRTEAVNTTPSVIVNTQWCQQNDLHWRKRTSQTFISFQNASNV